MKQARFFLPLSLALLATLIVGVAWALPQFTGSAPDDFIAADVWQINDNSDSPDVGLPDNAPDGAISGWDMAAVYFDYESSTDVMYIGIDCYGVCGDADGDGDPAATAPWLSANGGVDTADLSASENIGILIDTNNDYPDGSFEVVVGVDASRDISELGAYSFIGSPYTPPYGFGEKLSNSVDLYNTGPSASAPDLEFSIANFSQLPGFDFIPGHAFRFQVNVFAGSLQDDGVGEDFLPAVAQSVVIDIPSGAGSGAIGDTVWNDLNGNGFLDAGEPGIEGVTVCLYNGAVECTTTDNNGNYLFDRLPANTYTVKIEDSNFEVGAPLEGMVQTQDQSDSAADGANRMNPWTVTLNFDGEVYLLADFGYQHQSIGGMGCTPGYWKQKHHFDSWVNYDQDDLYDEIFGVDYGKTLLKALKQGGGHEKALGRHATAALLNAGNPQVDYAFTTGQIIQMVQDAYATGDFEGAKNKLEHENESGCPLN